MNIIIIFFLNKYLFYKKWICKVLYNYKIMLNYKIKITNINNYKIVNIIILLMIIKMFVKNVV